MFEGKYTIVTQDTILVLGDHGVSVLKRTFMPLKDL